MTGLMNLCSAGVVVELARRVCRPRPAAAKPVTVRNRWLILIVGAILFSLARPAPARAGDEAVNWLAYPEAVSRAAGEDRRLVLFFFSRYCRVCQVLEKKVFADPEIAGHLNRKFLCVRLDVAKEEKLVNRYRVYGTPVIHFLTPGLEKIESIPGYIEPDSFLRLIKSIGENEYPEPDDEDGVEREECRSRPNPGNGRICPNQFPNYVYFRHVSE